MEFHFPERAEGTLVKVPLPENWLQENAEAINSYNERAEEGVFSDGLRSF